MQTPISMHMFASLCICSMYGSSVNAHVESAPLPQLCRVSHPAASKHIISGVHGLLFSGRGLCLLSVVKLLFTPAYAINSSTQSKLSSASKSVAVCSPRGKASYILDEDGQNFKDRPVFGYLFRSITSISLWLIYSRLHPLMPKLRISQSESKK